VTGELSQRFEKLPDVIGIVGSRAPDPQRGRMTGWGLDGYPLIAQIVGRIQKVRHAAGGPATIVSGGANGVDRQVRVACRNAAFCFAEHMAIDPTSVDCPRDHFHEFLAQWELPDGSKDPQAGFRRNDKLVRHVGLLIAFLAPGEFTPGTADAIRRAREYEIPVLWFQEGRWHE
jgi:hypothetical protein